jgi:hypothetical protein
VVNIRSLGLCIRAAKLNGRDIMIGDISSAYLDAYSKERSALQLDPNSVK